MGNRDQLLVVVGHVDSNFFVQLYIYTLWSIVNSKVFKKSGTSVFEFLYFFNFFVPFHMSSPVTTCAVHDAIHASLTDYWPEKEVLNFKLHEN